ncbi:hypothetical protein BgiBS90_034617 [Biomphalaria glabrata]|nr:hypothetical protein BgiBS90_034617 [Biomphalaria glabrata]
MLPADHAACFEVVRDPHTLLRCLTWHSHCKTWCIHVTRAHSLPSELYLRLQAKAQRTEEGEKRREKRGGRKEGDKRREKRGGRKEKEEKRREKIEGRKEKVEKRREKREGRKEEVEKRREKRGGRKEKVEKLIY